MPEVQVAPSPPIAQQHGLEGPLVDQLPVPCPRCGAAMRLVGDAVTRVRCDFCRHEDDLPADAARQGFADTDRRIVTMIEGGWLSGTLKAALGPLALILERAAIRARRPRTGSAPRRPRRSAAEPARPDGRSRRLVPGRVAPLPCRDG